MSLEKEETVRTEPWLLPNHLSCLWMVPNKANENESEERREEKCASQDKCISTRERKRLAACTTISVKVKAAHVHEKWCCWRSPLSEISHVPAEKGKEGSWMRRH